MSGKREARMAAFGAAPNVIKQFRLTILRQKAITILLIFHFPNQPGRTKPTQSHPGQQSNPMAQLRAVRHAPSHKL